MEWWQALIIVGVIAYLANSVVNWKLIALSANIDGRLKTIEKHIECLESDVETVLDRTAPTTEIEHSDAA